MEDPDYLTEGYLNIGTQQREALRLSENGVLLQNLLGHAGDDGQLTAQRTSVPEHGQTPSWA